MFGDGSGTSDKPYSVVCAFLGKPRAWSAMNSDWEAVYKSRGLPEVHAVELFSNRHYATPQSKNPYKDWPDAEVRIFIDELASAVRKHRRSIKPIAIAVNNRDFHALRPREKQLLTSGRFLHWNLQRMKWRSTGKPSEPYMLVLQTLMKRAFDISDEESKVHFVLDRHGTDGISRLMVREIQDRQIWPEYPRLGEFTPGDSKHHPGIQMADMHAYLVNRYVLSQSGDIDKMRLEEEYALGAIFGWRAVIEMVNMKEMQATLDINVAPGLRDWLRDRS